jgi:muramidase (phage lysozyme)
MNYADFLENVNVRAFLAVIRECEGTAGPDGYRTMFGGELFDSFEDHPRRRITKRLGGRPLTSTAAGAYQFLERTWDGLTGKLGKSALPDFGPRSQDIAAVALIAGRRALTLLVDGDLAGAVKKCALEWASLPGSPYGQPTKSMDTVRAVYLLNGGDIGPGLPTAPASAPAAPATPAAPAVGRPKPAGGTAAALAALTPTKEKAVMAPFIPLAFSAIVEAVPALIRLFGSSEVSERNASAVELVVNAAKEATGSKNEQELIETLRTADPTTIAAVNDAVKGIWYEIANDTSGIQGAREANAASHEFWKQPAFYVTVMLLPLVYMVVWFVMNSESHFSDEVKAMVVAAIISGLLSGITGYWLGTSFSSSRKTDMLNKGQNGNA